MVNPLQQFLSYGVIIGGTMKKIKTEYLGGRHAGLSLDDATRLQYSKTADGKAKGKTWQHPY